MFSLEINRVPVRFEGPSHVFVRESECPCGICYSFKLVVPFPPFIYKSFGDSSRFWSVLRSQKETYHFVRKCLPLDVWAESRSDNSLELVHDLRVHVIKRTKEIRRCTQITKQGVNHSMTKVIE